MTTGRIDRYLVFALVLGAALWMVRAHWESVDIPEYTNKARLHAEVLAGTARDPYQYKHAAITRVFDVVQRQTDVSLKDIFFANTLLSLLFLTGMHHVWLRQWAPPMGAVIGTFVLTALANVTFRTYFHHPYEFWGVAMFCVLLVGIVRDWDWRVLCALSLVTGLVWEKHALLAPIWVLLWWLRGRPFWSTGFKGLGMLVCAVAVPIAIRIAYDYGLDAPRTPEDGMTYLADQKWGTVAWFQGTFVLPFLAIFILRFRRMPTLIRLLWLYLPVLVAAYLTQRYIIHEVRSFWALAPVFTATTVIWLAGTSAPPQAEATTPVGDNER